MARQIPREWFALVEGTAALRLPDFPRASCPLPAEPAARPRRRSRVTLQALEKLAPYLKPGKPWTAKASLPGGNFPIDGAADVVRALRAAYPFVTEAHAWRLVSAYGTRAPLFLAGHRSMSDLGHVFGADLTEAEVAWLMQEEWARTPDDVLWRRTKLGLRFTAEQVAVLDRWMAEAREHVDLPAA